MEIVLFIQELTVISNSVDSIENSFCEIFIYSKMKINTFWLKYFGVVNLSNYECSFVELCVLGKVLKFFPTPPMYDHGIHKESVDKFYRPASLKLF